ncbi:hypothetical protein GCM10010972_18740 [Cellulomonas carbonis]|nr:hypothetical protein GCM10010972_18740 [Cellulomonas carbonis]
MLMSTTPAAPLRDPPAVRLLGGFQLWHGARDVVLPPAAQRLVARVALLRRHARAVLAGELWPDVGETRAHANLRTCLWQVRRACPGLLVQGGDVLTIGADVDVDVHRAQALALDVLRDAGAVPTDALLTNLHALELLPGWYEDWVLAERERDRQLRLHALELSAHELVRRGLPGAAMLAALAAVQLEPLRESAQRAVIEVHLSEGNVAEALDRYRSYRTTILAEVGLEPTLSLQQMLGVAAPGLVRPRPLERPLAPPNGHRAR